MNNFDEATIESLENMNEGFGNAAQMPAIQQNSATSIADGVISAQRVSVARNYANIMQQIKALANAMGSKYYYHWNTKNKDGTKGTVEGGTIDLAMDLARLYGNCQVDCRVQDTSTHFVFHARFVDIETGFSLTRPFQQRKSQNIGKGMEADRQQDIVLQIGASKATRNVVLKSLASLAEFAIKEAKKGLLKKVSDNQDGARTAIKDMVDELKIDIKIIEAAIGNPINKWTVTDLAKVWVELTSIKDNYANVEDVYAVAKPDKLKGLIAEEKEKEDKTKALHDKETGEIADQKTEEVGKNTFTAEPIPLIDRINTARMEKAAGSLTEEEWSALYQEVKASGDKAALAKMNEPIEAA